MSSYFIIFLNETFLWYCFSDENIDGIKKLLPPFEVCGNDVVTKQSLLQSWPIDADYSVLTDKT